MSRRKIVYKELTSEIVYRDLQELKTKFDNHNHGDQTQRVNARDLLDLNFNVVKSGTITENKTFQFTSGLQVEFKETDDSQKFIIGGANGVLEVNSKSKTKPLIYLTQSQDNDANVLLRMHQRGNKSGLHLTNSNIDNCEPLVYLQQYGKGSGAGGLWIDILNNESTAIGTYFYYAHLGINTALTNTLAANVAPLLRLRHLGEGAHLLFEGDPVVASPADGEMWFDGTNLKMRIGATTYNLDMTAA